MSHKIFVAATSFCIIDGSRQSHDCKNARDLTTYELRQQLTEAKSKEENIISPFYLHPLLARSLGETDVNPGSLRHYRSQNYTIFGDRGCPKEIKANSHELMDISLCPWFVGMNYDAYRYPRSLLHARCRCERCVKVAKDISETAETFCQVVTIKEKVLRRQLSLHGTPLCEHGKALYESVWEDIPIACACVMRVAEKDQS